MRLENGYCYFLICLKNVYFEKYLLKFQSRFQTFKFKEKSKKLEKSKKI